LLPGSLELQEAGKHDSQNFPHSFIERLQSIIPPEKFDQVLGSFCPREKFSFRVNELVGPVERILAELRHLEIEFQPIDWLNAGQSSPSAFEANRVFRQRLTHSPLVDQGKIYPQNLSSMIAPCILGAVPGEVVLDLAAAPGGKTTHLAQLMKNQGQLSAVEAVRTRMFKLQANLKRCGVTICKTYLTDGRTVGQKTPERFDRVLLDAPCSSEARFQAGNPATWETWSMRKLRETSRKQIGLLKAAIHAAKIGGTILYCTCSFSPEENELVVDKVLKSFGDAVALDRIELPIDNIQPGLTEFENLKFDSQLIGAVRILPDQVSDAFFMAKIRKLKRSRRLKD
jgi:tRNA (cytosine49-C5)-methyltransferase